MNLDRWLQLMGRWGFSYNEETFSSLVVSYSEKGRHYHTQEHVAACLSHLDRCVSDIYDVFERGIRSEYKLVPTFIYRKKRAEILQGFLERPKIFQNELFSKERERQAKENLVNAVSKLGGRITNVAKLKR
jgi:predicted metal-dependent HD superfamily phosphohydrolase